MQPMSVAEIVMTLTLACAKNLIQVNAQLRAGERLNKKFRSLYSASLLTGKTFGIVVNSSKASSPWLFNQVAAIAVFGCCSETKRQGFGTARCLGLAR